MTKLILLPVLNLFLPFLFYLWDTTLPDGVFSKGMFFFSLFPLQNEVLRVRLNFLSGEMESSEAVMTLGYTKFRVYSGMAIAWPFLRCETIIADSLMHIDTSRPP